MISFMAEVIGIRDDMFLGAGNAYMREVGDALTDGTAQGVLHRRPSLINLQCDVDHPTQSLADLAWLTKHFGGLDQLRGKKLAMTWAYSPSYGKPLSVPQGIIGLMTRFGMEVSLAHPEGYGLIPEVLEVARQNAAASGGKFQVVNSMEEAFAGADIVYPKSWAPFHVMQERTELLKQSDREGLKQLEKACLANNARFKGWECDRAKMDLTAGKRALYMHCLPADITDVSCEAGEVSAEVFEQYRIPTYHEASYKPFVISALMFLTRISDPVKKLEGLVTSGRGLSI
jgi:knotted carbamoyltransferase YgeW